MDGEFYSRFDDNRSIILDDLKDYMEDEFFKVTGISKESLEQQQLEEYIKRENKICKLFKVAQDIVEEIDPTREFIFIFRRYNNLSEGFTLEDRFGGGSFIYIFDLSSTVEEKRIKNAIVRWALFHSNV